MSSSPINENISYEHGLRQKLMLMENAVARIASVKSQLRTNAEQVRKDISNSISHQLQCIRAREQELLGILESIVNLKEQNLEEQKEQLNQAIGACQQSIECVLRDKTDSINVQDMLFRLNTIDLRPRDNSHVAFEVDPSALRRAIVDFGRVVSDHRQKTQCESLPIDIEEYDDGTSLAHKSVFRFGRPEISAPSSVHNWLTQLRSRQISESDGTWIDDLDLIKHRAASFGSSIEVINKDDAISNPSDVFNVHFNEIKQSPLDKWLKHAPANVVKQEKPKNTESNDLPKNFAILPIEMFVPKSQITESQIKLSVNSEMKDLPKNFAIPPIEMFAPKNPTIEAKPRPPIVNKLINSFEGLNIRRPASTDQEDLPANKRKKIVEQTDDSLLEAEKCFKSMLDSIKCSDKSHWLISEQVDKEETPQTPNKTDEISVMVTPKPIDGKITSELLKEVLNKEKRIWYPTAVNQNKLTQSTGYINDNSLWLKNYPTKNSGRPSNEMAHDVATWESVLGWKNILEKIHASGEDEWLVPASRNFKSQS